MRQCGCCDGVVVAAARLCGGVSVALCGCAAVWVLQLCGCVGLCRRRAATQAA